MTLATADPEGRPSARTVLLKEFDSQGFIFYTNYESRKAQELAKNPQARTEHDLPGVGRVVEESRFDGNVDRVRKTLRLESGEVLSAEFHIRYYLPAALATLAYVAGLRFVRLHEPLTETTPQLIARLEK